MRCQPQIYIKKRQIGGVFCHTVVKSTVLRRGKINIYAAKIYNYATEFMEEFMTLGEKLAKLRRENNHTQEQLADILGVSRQSVSKWESDLAYPETDKIIKIGELYNCSLDYLLKENSHERQAEERGGTQEPQTGSRYTITFDLHSFHFERKSKIMIGKLPLWHINIGFGRTAKGFFAVGLCARGIFAGSALARGVFRGSALAGRGVAGCDSSGTVVAGCNISGRAGVRRYSGRTRRRGRAGSRRFFVRRAGGWQLSRHRRSCVRSCSHRLHKGGRRCVLGGADNFGKPRQCDSCA